MTFDGFDAAVLIESIQTASLPLPPETAEGPTLQDALAANRDALVADLWQSRAGGNGPSDLGEIVAMPLRPLNADEMLLLAGGAGSEFTVWGPSGGGGWGGWGIPPYDDGGGGGSTGGNGGPTDYLENYYSQCELDNMVDFKAQQLSDLIKAQPDWNSREYAAVIYMVNGEVRVGPLIAGQTVAEALAAGHNAPATPIYAPADLGDGIILAVIHSHPDVGYDAAGDIRNQYPSNHAGGDYDAFAGLVGSDPRFSNNAAFAQYILGPDGTLREFNAKDGRITSANDTNPAIRSNLAADRPCSQ